ncbi:HET-domain-containing protein [Periconia macrospinosa]|uniref:HET-domain-containing protein n=1 Tax=Periconia macrospinosa TaxID=97972 RepID=A0A2V1DP34_9PLEO|nr:HET-domain-containing protein [Periconia macrospinosa]
MSSSEHGVYLTRPKSSQSRRCTLCKLIDRAIEEYAPVCDSYITWVGTRDRWEQSGSLRVIAKKEAVLVIRAYGMKPKTRRVLFDWLVRGKQTIPQYVDINCTILLQAGDAKQIQDPQMTESRPPRRYRTIPKNTYDPCWLYPSLRWSTIQNWITVCQLEHDDCSNPISPQLPSRYLDVGVSATDPIKLVVSNGACGQYACLSHCWGGAQPCKLTEETKSDYATEIPRTVLTAVFLDAIEVCKRIGLRRIWIDSLCIQQDSKEDWQHESQKMGQYYSNCTICISATSSASSFKTFEIVERPTVASSSGIDPETGPFSLLAYPFDLMEKKPHFGHSDKAEVVLENFPLLTRGWVFQERWLSPRVLHFCGHEAVFECAKLTTCECGQARVDFMDHSKEYTNLRGTTTSQEGLISKRSRLEHMSWDHLVTAYSSLKLTYNTDRLIAISGLASTLYEKRNKHYEGGEHAELPLYLAGIWRMDLLRDMTWFVGPSLIFATTEDTNAEAVASGIVRNSRYNNYVAPSWSWASVSDPIRYLLLDKPDSLFTLRNAHINLATDNPFGPVREGCYLHLKGKILTSSWELQTDIRNISVYILKDITGTQLLSRPEQRGIKFSPDYAVAKPGLNQLHPKATLYVFPLGTTGVAYTRTVMTQSDRAVVAEFRSTICLVLKKVEKHFHGMNVYERVGLTEYANYQNGTKNVDPNQYTEEELCII